MIALHVLITEMLLATTYFTALGLIATFTVNLFVAVMKNIKTRQYGTVIMSYDRVSDAWESHYIGRGCFVYIQETSGKKVDTSDPFHETIVTLCLPVRLLKTKKDRDYLVSKIRDIKSLSYIKKIETLNFIRMNVGVEHAFSKLSDQKYVQFCIEPVGEGKFTARWPHPNITLPSNSMKPGETLEQSAFREYMEETHCIPNFTISEVLQNVVITDSSDDKGNIYLTKSTFITYICDVSKYSYQKSDIEIVKPLVERYLHSL